MIISKKKFEEAIKEAECRVSKHYEDERCRLEEERYQSGRINGCKNGKTYKLWYADYCDDRIKDVIAWREIEPFE